jgi:hypothetical protein
MSPKHLPFGPADRSGAEPVVTVPDQVMPLVVNAHTTASPVETSRRPLAGRVWVTTSLRRPPVHRRQSLRPWLIGGGVLVGIAAVAGVVWLLVAAVMAAIAWAHTHLLVLCAAAVFALFVLARCAAGKRSSSCPGLHCQGCRR